MFRFPDHEPLFTWSHSIRSRYGETDKMGYVYYGRYLEYFEVARTEMIRNLGLPYSKLEEEGIMLPVTEVAVKYHSPIYYDEVMQVKVMIYDLPQVRLYTYYQVFTARQEEPHVVGSVTLAFSDAASRRPCRAPAYFIDKLKPTAG